MASVTASVSWAPSARHFNVAAATTWIGRLGDSTPQAKKMIAGPSRRNALTIQKGAQVSACLSAECALTRTQEPYASSQTPVTNAGSSHMVDLTEYVVLTFYHLVDIENPHEEVARHLAFMQDKDIQGRIYINHQGINAQLSGPFGEALAYAEWIKKDARFHHLLVQISAAHGHAFPRLRLRYKPSLIQVECGTACLPLTDASMRATLLSPREWGERLNAISVARSSSACADVASQAVKKTYLLDLRNGYEWDVGHFVGAARPDIDCFRNTDFGLSETMTTSKLDLLENVNKEVDEILMYCTSGIRCDVYSTLMRQKGFKNLYSLHGGITHYLEKEGPANWAGNVFVFDSRLAMRPSQYQQQQNLLREAPFDTMEASASAFARCELCKNHLNETRHRNCANVDCNKLYLSCENCVQNLKGCCCVDCTGQPRLRPVLDSGQQYQRWHNYCTS